MLGTRVKTDLEFSEEKDSNSFTSAIPTPFSLPDRKNSESYLARLAKEVEAAKRNESHASARQDLQ